MDEELTPAGVQVNSGALSPAAKISRGDSVETAEEITHTICFTIVESNTGPLTKRFTVDESGNPIVSSSSVSLYDGTATRVVLHGTATEIMKGLAGKLQGLKSNQAIILAPPPAGKDERFLVLKHEAEGRDDVVARSPDYFQPPAGPALMGLDCDVKDFPKFIVEKLKAAGRGPLLAALSAVCPAMAGAASVIRRSASSGIRKPNNREPPSIGGLHCYYLVLDGTDIADFVQRYADRLMLAGWGWGYVTKSGTILFRTLFDIGASKDTSRLWFETDAILDPPLEYEPDIRKPKVKRGGFLDTKDLAPLSADERDELARIKAQIRIELAAEAAARRQEWVAERRPALTARGVSPEIAEKILNAAVERSTLPLDFPIVFDDGSVASVAEILRNKALFHEKTCADPLEPEYGGGRNIAITYTDGRPHIYSFAHGGIDYDLEFDVASYFEKPADDPDEWPEPVDIFGDGDPSSLMDVPAGALPDVLDRFVRDVRGVRRA